MANKFYKPTCLIVEWGDAWGDSGWQDPSRLERDHESLPVKTIGFAFKKNKKGITLVSGFDDRGTPIGAIFIPKKMIKKIKKIRY